jgi:hypothetical protein
MTRDAVAPADQEHSDETRFPNLPSPAAGPSAVGCLEIVMDVFTTALGLLVFGLIAGVFLVMA